MVTTIDGWALRVAGSFPTSCPLQASPDNPQYFYPEIRNTVHRFLSTGSIHETVSATYSRLFVDEYQDCNVDQHNLIVALSSVLPTVVFGDPMQCIFDFSGSMPQWEDVLNQYPLLDSLSTPWRWNNAGAPELGQWVLSAREALLHGNPVDFNSCPAHVISRELTGRSQEDLSNQQDAQNSILNLYPDDSLLVIGSSRNVQSRHHYARGSYGTGVVEPVQLADVIRTIQKFDNTTGVDLADAMLQIANNIMTNVERPQTLRRLDSIIHGRNRTPPTIVEQALCDVVSDNSNTNILRALHELERKPGTRIYRRSAYNVLKDSVSLALNSPDKTIFEAASIMRERLRQRGDRRIPKRAIGSTLLLKGLEADHSLILDANEMNSKNLYVALSRGARTVTIFS